MPEEVNHPDHYGGADNPYEAIKVIEAWKLNFNLGMLSFLVMRITGIALTLYIFAHIFTLGAILLGDEAFNQSLGKFDTPFGHLLEYLLLLCVLVHVINGCRILLTDFLGLSRSHERLFWCGLGTFVVIAFVSLFIFF